MQGIKYIVAAGALFGASINAMDKPTAATPLAGSVARELNEKLWNAAATGNEKELAVLLEKLGKDAHTCIALYKGSEHPHIVRALAQHCCCKRSSKGEESKNVSGDGLKTPATELSRSPEKKAQARSGLLGTSQTH